MVLKGIRILPGLLKGQDSTTTFIVRGREEKNERLLKEGSTFHAVKNKLTPDF